MHYFRIPREYWDDRLHKLRMGGPNVIDFYIDWSGHEPEPGQYNFVGNYDLLAFLEAIQKADLLATIRPGPFVCGEIDNAGFPYWLLRKHPHMQYRSMGREYVEEVTKWFNKLLPMLVPYLYKNGGPIIMLQVENEYGHLDGGCDPRYMEFVLSLQEKLVGKDVVMFRSDAPVPKNYECDKVRDILVAGNCDPKSNPPVAFEIVRKAQVKPGAPIVVAEYYTGWMDYWGWNHNPAFPPAVISTFEKMMENSANVIFYMFHGGTSFGFKAATSSESPLVTSYDYDAPIGEDGDPKNYYYALRKAIGKYIPLKSGELPKPTPKMQVDALPMQRCASLHDVMDHFRKKNWLKRATSRFPQTFEELGQDFGFLHYSTEVSVGVSGRHNLSMHGLRDRAQVFLRNETFIIMQDFGISTMENPKLSEMVTINKGDRLEILVENMGREDFGPGNRDFKGLRNVSVGNQFLTNWTTEAVPVTRNRDITELLHMLANAGEGDCKPPCFFYGSFKLNEGQERLDTFLDPWNYTKGIALVNGINVGRYWPRVGPQIRLYVPGVFLRPHPEENHLIMFELEGLQEGGKRGVRFIDRPHLTGDAGRAHP